MFRVQKISHDQEERKWIKWHHVVISYKGIGKNKPYWSYHKKPSQKKKLHNKIQHKSIIGKSQQKNHAWG